MFRTRSFFSANIFDESSADFEDLSFCNPADTTTVAPTTVPKVTTAAQTSPDSPTTDPLTTDPPTTDHPTTDHPTTDLPTTDPPTTDPPTTDPPTTDPPSTDPPTTDPPTTDPPTTDPPTTDLPTTDPATTDPPTTDPPTTDPPTTDPPTTDPPTTDPPTTGLPTFDPPTTDAPTTDPPTTDLPTTGPPTTDPPTTDPQTTPTNYLPTTTLEPSPTTVDQSTPGPTPAPGQPSTAAPACDSPSITIISSGTEVSLPRTHYVSDPLEIEAEVSVECDVSSIKYTWLMQNNVISDEEEVLRPLSVPVFGLPIGLVSLCLRVASENEAEFIAQTKCNYLDVKVPKLVAVLKLDADIADYREKMFLDSLSSYDPMDVVEVTDNLKPESLKYTWTCSVDMGKPIPSNYILGNGAEGSFCSSSLPEEIEFCQNEPECQIKPSEIGVVINVWYIFKVFNFLS